ncbi:redoxin domain-containing protein [candidate division KSB1 bacterium]|nr:redoxin domain-containing protein [candidate division KSB1 bacterium]
MKRSWPLLVLLLCLSMYCHRAEKPIVAWTPDEPQTNTAVTIYYLPQGENARLVGSNAIFFIYEIHMINDVVVKSSPMVLNGSKWEIQVQLPDSACLICFKFEDDANRVDDNKGRGWYIPINNQQGELFPGTDYKIGQLFLSHARPEAFPDFQQARRAFVRDIKVQPDHVDSWFTKWSIDKYTTKNTAPIKKTLDSLLVQYPDNGDFTWLAFQTHWKIFGDVETAMKYGTQFIKQFPSHDRHSQVAYDMLQLRNRTASTISMNELKKLINTTSDPDVSGAVLFRMANQYLHARDVNNAKNAFAKMAKLDSTDTQSLLTLASMEIQIGDYNSARKNLSNVLALCTDQALLKHNPWMHPGKRTQQKYSLLTQIHSATANVEDSAGQFAKAISHRKKVLSLGTPFPAYEWTKIGDAYTQLGEPDNARDAYVQAVLVAIDHTDAYDKLIALASTLKIPSAAISDSIVGWVTKAEQQQMKKAPAFCGTDVDNKRICLSDFKNEIVVLYFWSSWSKACRDEIASLNELVHIFGSVADVHFIAISNEYKTSIVNFLVENPFNYQQVQNASQLIKDYEIIGYPTHIIIDREGNIRKIYTGFTPGIKDKLQADLTRLLKTEESPS